MENTKNFYRAGPILFCYDNSGSWNSINPILTDTLFMWNYAKVVVGFMNSSAINNNHICILVMGYTTPETSKGADMTFWGWMWMYMQGMEVIYSWKLFEFWKFLRLPQSSIFFFLQQDLNRFPYLWKRIRASQMGDVSASPSQSTPTFPVLRVKYISTRDVP